MIEQGCPEEWRPKQCRHCQAVSGIHRHGRYYRKLYTLFDVLKLVIFRFKCTTCGKTFALLPPFVIPHRGASLDIQEELIRKTEQGYPLEAIAEKLTPATEPYSPKTLWRWKKEWNSLRVSLEATFWAQVFTRFPHIRSPEGTNTGWGWIFTTWQQIRDELTGDEAGCLQWLKYLARSRAAAERATLPHNPCPCSLTL